MKTLLTTGLLCTIIGAAVGWMNAADHYEAKARKEQGEMRAAQDERNAHLSTLSRNYYEQFEAISNREPATVERRVFVKADCVPTGTSTGMDNAAYAGGAGLDPRAVPGTGVAELHRDTVDRVAQAADKAEKRYQQCSVRLRYFQDRFKQ